MSQLVFGVEVFRLRKGGVECDERGLRVAGDDLLEKSQIESGWRWRVADLSAVESTLARAYGCEIEAKGKLGALKAIAAALDEENTALAQIGALLLQLPDPLTTSHQGDGGGFSARLCRTTAGRSNIGIQTSTRARASLPTQVGSRRRTRRESRRRSREMFESRRLIAPQPSCHARTLLMYAKPSPQRRKTM